MTTEDEPVGSAQFAGAQRDVERLIEANATPWSIVNAVWSRCRTAHSKEGSSSETTREARLAALAEQLCRQYEYRSLTEVEKEDPECAREHRDAAVDLLPWIEERPREERRNAFERGYDKGRERQKARTAADMRRLEAEVAELRQDRDPEGLRARIRELEHVLQGWDRFMTGRIRHGQPVDWKDQAAEYLAQLVEVQRELAVLKGVQPSNATRESSFDGSGRA